MVFDLGGGTFDVSLLDISDGVFEVLATNGRQLVSAAMTSTTRVIDWIAEELHEGQRAASTSARTRWLSRD